jgi:hypothetical protein
MRWILSKLLYLILACAAIATALVIRHDRLRPANVVVTAPGELFPFEKWVETYARMAVLGLSAPPPGAMAPDLTIRFLKETYEGSSIDARISGSESLKRLKGVEGASAWGWDRILVWPETPALKKSVFADTERLVGGPPTPRLATLQQLAPLETRFRLQLVVLQSLLQVLKSCGRRIQPDPAASVMPAQIWRIAASLNSLSDAQLAQALAFQSSEPVRSARANLEEELRRALQAPESAAVRRICPRP